MKTFTITITFFFSWLLLGCYNPPIHVPKEAELKKMELANRIKGKDKDWYRDRRPIPVRSSQYEGSLWRDESSWGNLLRDHRARFKNDVVTITGVSSIISLPEPPPAAPAEPRGRTTPGAQARAVAGAALDTMGVPKSEKEQNDILRSIKTISARIVRVYQNGNMLVKGEKIDNRQQNTIRYVTTVTGIIRPEDVSEKNEVSATRLANSQVKTKRQVIARKLKSKSLDPVIGKENTGVMDRMGHLLAQ